MFCSLKDVYDLVFNSANANVDPIYFNRLIEMVNQRVSSAEEYVFEDENMNLAFFMLLIRHLQQWYHIRAVDIANFIERKFKEKYVISKSDILNVISQAMADDDATTVKIGSTVAPTKLLDNFIKTRKDESQEKTSENTTEDTPKDTSDMFKIVQGELKNGMTKAEVREKYNLNQRELTMYEGPKYWTSEQKSDHKTMLEYMRCHPGCSNKEAIEKGCKKQATGYRYALVPTKEQVEEYVKKVSEKPTPKAVIKGTKVTDVKSLILSDTEKEEQQALYSKIKEIATARNSTTTAITSLLKSRLVKDYGIVIEQIKKDLMIKYRVNRGEGKAPNALEAIVMSEYLPIAKSILDDMLTESFSVK